ncbi:MAG: hypothetical protein IE885_00260 [Campylobacterales bacterium]|nr:hypothetical protein [Campylobacterales bacterium]
MSSDKKDSKNIILVAAIIGAFLVFMLASAVYSTSQVLKCSSAKKLRKECHLKLDHNPYRYLA